MVVSAWSDATATTDAVADPPKTDQHSSRPWLLEVIAQGNWIRYYGEYLPDA